jgi:5-formyltetrahydrofolate cyclo-ligase
MSPRETPPSEAKKTLRRAMRAVLKGLGAEERKIAGAKTCERLLKHEIWRGASTVLCYAPMPGELDISVLIDRALADGKVVSLPQYDPERGLYRAACITVPVEQVPLGAFGIREPGRHCPSMPLNQLDLILVPGLAFGSDGRRLGHGKGFYDRLLMGISAAKCGVAFDEQIRPHIPVEPHDVLVDCIVTPERWLDFRRDRFGDELAG